MNSETENKLSTEGLVIFEMFQDQIAAQQLAALLAYGSYLPR